MKLQVSPRVLFDTISQIVRGLPAYQAGGVGPQAFTVPSFLRLPDGEKNYVIELVSHLGLGEIRTIRRAGKASDQYRFVPGGSAPSLLGASHDRLVEFLRPLAESEGENNKILAQMIGLRSSLNFQKKDLPLFRRVDVRGLLDPAPIPVQTFYARMMDRGGSPILHLKEVEELITQVPLSGECDGPIAQRYWTFQGGRVVEKRHPLCHIGGKGMIG